MKTSKGLWRKRLAVGESLHWFHWVIVFASLLLTLSASYITYRQISDQNQARFDYQAQHIIRQVVERMTNYEAALWSGVAALNALPPQANREDWRSFTNSLKIDQRFPGINGIGVIHYVEHSQLNDYLAWQRVLMPEFQLRPETSRDDYWPVSYVEPEESNAQAIGLDMSHEHNRYQAALASRASGTAQITGPIELVQDAKRTPGFLFYTPWYESNKQPDDIAVQSDFLGLVYAPFIVYKLMDGTLANINRQVHFSIQDSGKTLYSELSPESEAFDPSPLFRTTKTLALYGRQWQFEVQSSQIFRQQHQSRQPLMILVSGILIDGLLLALFILLANSNRKASLQAQEATRELADQTGRLKQNAMRLDGAMNAMMDGLLLIDEVGVIQTLNDATLKMFGYSRQELVGTKVNQLMDDKEAEQHDGYLARKTPEADNPMLGKERKLMAKRSDGSLFPIRLNVSKGIIDGQVFYTGIIHDLSRLNESQLQLQKSEKLLQVALHSSGTATCMADIRGNFIEANTAFCDWLGYRYEEILDKSVVDMVSHEHREEARQGIFALIKRESLSITQQKQSSTKAASWSGD